MRTALPTIVLLAAMLVIPLSSAGARDIVVLASSDIIQFTTCIEGIQSSLSEHSLRQIELDRSVKKGHVKLQELSSAPPAAVIAVGTQAAQALAENFGLNTVRVFSMVLDPEAQFAGLPPIPGVSLNIPPGFQLHQIKKAFPQRKSVGIFFNPAYNRTRVDEFIHEATAQGLMIIELPVAAERDIAPLINSDSFRLDVLLIIPDRTLSSPKIIEYIIRESLKNKIPVVGYNSWFAQSGAVLSFIIDYEAVGRQTGRLVQKLLSAEPESDDVGSGIEPPREIRISINVRTAERLGIAVEPAFINQADEVVR